MKNWQAPLDPTDFKDYVFGWASLLENEDNDTISTQEITLSDASIALGLEFETDTIIDSSTNVQLFFRVNASFQSDEAYDGQGQVFNVKNKIVTAAGKTFEKTVQLIVRQL